MGIYDKVTGSVNDIIDQYKATTTDGKMTYGEVSSLAFNAAASFVHLIESFGFNDGETKKGMVLAAVSKFYDFVIAPIDIQLIPDPLEGLADQAIKGVLLATTNASIDAIVHIFNVMGWNSKTEDAVFNSTDGGPVIEKIINPIVF
jgi:hypothetical protein